ncbi:MAG TPA: flagellar export chaperone FliS [Anaerohalosphaeraceae bacterium]|nr:flagellar export chaperone FliS [Anaerohalosphaeraceae bacterium]HOL89898.1 flagellar export chaperone FliS [Anaerohalosphaeraceae bacterium]HOQ04434.1 flagellar export chaperone FliS [Anaerohalosphaeraceae bacterium]HPP57138.1 flagellar export chaperone FliS [Anaerohalosphaeraceae bacterium]
MSITEIYQETAVTTQNKGRLIVLLYEGAIRFLHQARTAIQNGNFTQKAASLAKARDIIFELNQSLNLEQGGSLAQNLRGLYNFLWRYIGQAGIQNNTEMLDKSIHILEDLASAWRKVCS